MIDARKAITTKLKTICARTYFQTAAVDATFPYLVFGIPSSFNMGENQEDMTVEIDGWDNKEDTTALETLMQSVEAIGNTVLTEGSSSFIIYLENKLALEDEDKRIKRRKYTFRFRKIKGD